MRYDLHEYFYITKEINLLRQRIADLESRATSTTSNVSGGAPNGISDKTGLASEIADWKTKLELKLDEREKVRIEIEKYIENIPDSRTRMIFYYRHIRLCSWHRVAQEISPYETEEACRKTHDRYIERTEKEECMH